MQGRPWRIGGPNEEEGTQGVGLYQEGQVSQ